VGQVKRGWGVGAHLLPVLGKGGVFGAVRHLNEKSRGSSVVTAEQSGCLWRTARPISIHAGGPRWANLHTDLSRNTREAFGVTSSRS